MAYKKVSAARKRHSKFVVTNKLKMWHREHKNDPEYLAKRAAGVRKHLEQLYRDAELGRMARIVLTDFGGALMKLVALNREFQETAKEEAQEEAK